jgi:hypothetical protein
LAGRRVVAVSAAFVHSLALTADGTVLPGWLAGAGASAAGCLPRLGHGEDLSNQLLPKKVEKRGAGWGGVGGWRGGGGLRGVRACRVQPALEVERHTAGRWLLSAREAHPVLLAPKEEFYNINKTPSKRRNRRVPPLVCPALLFLFFRPDATTPHRNVLRRGV